MLHQARTGKVVLHSKLILFLAAMTMIGTAQGETIARSVVSDPRSGAVYTGNDAASSPAAAATVVMKANDAAVWSTPVDGAATVDAVALSPDGLFIYAAGSRVSGSGFVVRLNAGDGSVAAKLELGAAARAMAASPDGAIFVAGARFVLKLNAALQAVIFAADPGGTAVGLAVDPRDSSLYAALAVEKQAVGAKLSADGKQWLFRTLLGEATPAGLAFDGQAIYLAGSTGSRDFLLKNAPQSWQSGTSDAFLTKIGAADGVVAWSTYFGGAGADAATALAISEDGTRLVAAGWTTSLDFPGAPLDTIRQGGEEGILAEIDPASGRVLKSAYLDRRINAISMSGAQTIMAGANSSTSLPTTRLSTALAAATDTLAASQQASQAAPAAAVGTTITVNAACTLGLAIKAANAALATATCPFSGSGLPYTINLPSFATYAYSTSDNNWYGPNALPPIATTIVIQGNGSTLRVAAGTKRLRFFYVGADRTKAVTLNYNTPGPGNLTLRNLTLTGGVQLGGNGVATGGGGAGMGGAIFNQGMLTLDTVTMTGNSATGGKPGISTFGGIGGGGGMGEDAYNERGGGFGAPVYPAGSSGADGAGFGGGGGGFGVSDNGLANGIGGGTPDGLGGAGGGRPFGVRSGNGSGGGGLIGKGKGGGFGLGGRFEGNGGGGVGGGGGSVATSPGSSGGGGFGGGGGSTQNTDPMSAGTGGFGGGSYIGSGGVGSPGFGAGYGGAGMGGAIFNHNGTLQLSNSTLTTNSAVGGSASIPGLGGAIFNLNGTVTLTSTSITGNRAGSGGGVYNLGYNLRPNLYTASTTVINSNVIRNTSNDMVNHLPSNVTQSAGGGVNAAKATMNYQGTTLTSTVNTGGTITGVAACLSNPVVSDLTDSPVAFTLRFAVTYACEGSTIKITSSGTISLASRILLNKSLTIQGPGAPSLTISGAGVTRIFFVGTGTLTPFTGTVNLSGLTLANGYGKGGNSQEGGAAAGMGGAIFQNGGILNLSNMAFAGNRAVGGSVLAAGAAGQTGGAGFGGDAPADGTAAGGGDLGGAAGVYNSQSNAGPGAGGAFDGDGGFGGGGGVHGDGGFGAGGGGGSAGANFPGGFGGFGSGHYLGTAGGPAAGFGGAIFAYAGTLNITGVTFSNNHAIAGGTAAEGRGGALFVYAGPSGATAKAANITFSGNVAANAGIDTASEGTYNGAKQCPGFDNRDVCGVLLGLPATLTANPGSTPQTATVNKAFANALSLTVKDLGNNPVPGETVTFTAPASGASGKFSNNTATIAVVANASGVASNPFTANATAGSYSVSAQSGWSAAVSFPLTNIAGLPTSMTANAGATPQTANVGTAFIPLAVTVRDASNNPVSGVNVTFLAPASGASGKFANNTVTVRVPTNVAGVASAPFTANTLTGPYPVTASAAGLTTVSFSLTNRLVSATSMTTNPGTTPQSTPTSTAFTALAVTLKDAGNHPVAGVNVTFTAPASGASGRFSNNSTTIIVPSNALGVASAAFTANSTRAAGAPYLVTASVAGLTAVNFALTNRGPAVSMAVNAGTTPQTVAVNTAFPVRLAVTVKDASNNPVPGVSVTFRTPPPSGPTASFGTGSSALFTATIATNDAGIATAPILTANATAGVPYGVTTTATGLPAVSFLLANAGPAVVTTINPNSTPQSAAVSTAFPQPLALTVTDAFGNPVAGMNVRFTAPASGASGRFSNGTAVITIATNASGIASVPFTANAVAGAPYLVIAATTGPQRFALTNRGAAAALTANVGSTPQSAPVNVAFPSALAVTVKDTFGNAVPGVSVVFTAPASGASGRFGNGTTTITVVSDAFGIAAAPFTANSTTGGPYSVVAAAAGLVPVNFSLINGATLLPTSMTVNPGTTPQSAAINTAFANAFAVTVKNSSGGPVPGVSVTFTAPSSGVSGRFSNGAFTVTTTTNAAGVASAPFTANETAGPPYLVTATSTGLSPVSFSVANAGAAASVTANAGSTPQSTVVNTAFPNPLSVTVRDTFSNPVPGVSVTFMRIPAAASGNFSSGTDTITVVTNASGIASTPYTANQKAGGPHTVRAGVPSRPQAVFTLTNTP